MSTPPIPMPLRAAAGLAAVAIDEARRLPRRLVGLPVLAVSTALQASLKVQQHYAELATRGDELLGQLHGQREGTPSWARFDEDEEMPVRPRPPSDGGLSKLDAIAEAEAADRYDDASDVVAVAEAVDGADAELAAAELRVDAELLAGPEVDAAIGGVDTAPTPPVAGYDELTIAQLRARLRKLTEAELTALLAYEHEHGRRAPYLTMLENRLTTVRNR